MIPSVDRNGAIDHPLIKRIEGSYIVSNERQSLMEYTLPLSRLEPVEPARRDNHNNVAFEPKRSKSIEGAYTRLVYLLPAGRSPLEVVRSYQQEIKDHGGRILFECKGTECGGNSTSGSSGGGGYMSLGMYLFPEDRLKDDPRDSNGWCATASRIADQHYSAGEIPAANVHVSVLSYSIRDHSACSAFNDRTIALVDIIEDKPQKQKMVRVEAGEMARQISTTGSVSLYGVYFDFNQSEIKPESDATLEQIGKLLKDSAGLKLLVVGHTDNVGTFAFNLDLSQRRAAAVVNALATRFGIGIERLTPVGVSFASPVASTNTEEGRAKNRRVQLVQQ